MSINFSCLTPAPWVVETIDTFKVIRDEVTGGAMLLPEDDENERHIAAMEFAALARNAEDVLIRRGWGIRQSHDGKWMVMDNVHNLLWHENRQGGYFTGFNHPFKALVESDVWWKENVEQKETARV